MLRRRRRPVLMPASARRWLLAHEGILLPAGSLVVFLVAWQLASSIGLINKFFFSSPLDVAQAGLVEVQTEDFWTDVWISGSEFLIGYFAAIAVAAPFGIVTGLNRRLGYAVEPWINALNATPRIALLPLIVLWVGVGQGATTVAVFLGVFFPVAMNCFYGVHTVNRSLATVAESFGASPVKRLASVVLPAMVPFILAGARLGIGRGVVGVVIGEFYSSSAGLGNYIFRAGATLQVDRVLFGAAFITILAMVAFTFLKAVEHRFEGWRPKVEFGGAIP